jgi:hypothetical protein
MMPVRVSQAARSLGPGPLPGNLNAQAATVLVLVRGSKHTWLGIQRRKRRALVRMESG